jgi:hypothetical protein
MYHSAVQYLDYDVSTLISETFLPDQVSKNTLRATLSVFHKNNYVMGVRAGSKECCKASSIAKARKIHYDPLRIMKLYDRPQSVRLYLREANLLSKKYKLLKKLRTAMYPIEVHEYDVDIPPRRARENHQIEWKGMKIKF